MSAVIFEVCSDGLVAATHTDRTRAIEHAERLLKSSRLVEIWRCFGGSRELSWVARP